MRIDRLAIYFRPQNGPFVVHFGRVAAVKHAVHGQIFPEVRHIAVHSAVEHIFLYQGLFYEFDRRGVSEVEHTRVERCGLDVVYLAFDVANEHSFFGTLVIKSAPLDKVRIYVRQEAHPFFVQRAHGIVEIRI